MHDIIPNNNNKRIFINKHKISNAVKSNCKENNTVKKVVSKENNVDLTSLWSEIQNLISACLIKNSN